MNQNQTGGYTVFPPTQEENMIDDNDDDDNDDVNVGDQREENTSQVLVRNHNDELVCYNSEDINDNTYNNRKSNLHDTETGLTSKHLSYHSFQSREKPLPHRHRNDTYTIETHQAYLKEGFDETHRNNLTCDFDENEIQEVNDSFKTNVQHADLKLNELETGRHVQQGKRPLPRPRTKSAVKELRSYIETTNEKVETNFHMDDNNELTDESSKIANSNLDKDFHKKANSQEKRERKLGASPRKTNNGKRGDAEDAIEIEDKREAKNETSEDNAQTGRTCTESEKIIGIIVHRSEYLQTDMLVQHPVVKVHLLDANTGKYLKKSCPDRPASFYYENKDIDFILPLMTKSFNFKLKRSLVPVWEEVLIFNEDIQHILKEEPPVLIMFEILDFVNFSTASSQYKKLGPEGGWHKIAWAFLKPLGANRHYNVEKKLRLQLYKPVFSPRIRGEQCDVYSWWTQQIWERYPATLYVTVKGVTPPENVSPALRSQIALQQEKTSDILEFDNQGDGEHISELSTGTQGKMCDEQMQSCPVWSRLPAQSCKVPNETKLSIGTLSKGCFLAKFSNSGLLIACTMANEDMISINLYTIPDGKEYATFLGHRGLIYDLCWSSSDSMLLSGSADCTVCIWDVEKRRTNCLQMLPHPSFVYSAKFHGHRSWLLATGCNDHVVRLWVRQHKANRYDLVQELEGHEGFINSLCFIQQHTLLSADSIGSIFVWSCDKHSFSRKNITPWEKVRELVLRELKGIVINKILVHPGGRRLLIHSRDNLLRMLDITTGIAIQWFQGVINHRVQTTCCISPCGSLVFAASEEGSVYVWNADTGDLIALYSGLNFHDTITCVDYHPFEHMVAFSSHGSSSRVLVCMYSKLSSGVEVGLQMMNRESYKKFNQEKSLLRKDKFLASTTKDYSKNDLKLSSKNEPSLSKDDVTTDQNAEENPNTEESTSGCWNGTSDGSSLKLESLPNNVEHKKKIDLAYLISRMDQILFLNAQKNTSKDIQG